MYSCRESTFYQYFLYYIDISCFQAICKWLGTVHDCYVLPSRSLWELFQRFDANNFLEIIYESDEEKEDESVQIIVAMLYAVLRVAT